MNKLIDASDVARRDKMASVAAWVRSVSMLRVAEGKIEKAWDGTSVSDEAVEAMVNTGRVGAECIYCGKHEYVSFAEPIFFCMDCGNANSGAAMRVTFPQDWAEVEAALIARPIFPGPGLDEVQAVFRSRPVMRELKRNWKAGVTAKELKAENSHYKFGGSND